MVRACDTIVADASSPLDEHLSSSEMCFSDMDSGWYDTPPDTPRSLSPDLLAQLTSVPFCLSLCASTSSKKDALDRLILDCDEYLNPLHPKPSSPVMWNSNVCERGVLLEGKESSPLPLDSGVIEEISSEAFLGLLDRDSIFTIDESFSTKRKNCDEESLESKKAKARKTRDALSDQVPCSPDSRRYSHSGNILVASCAKYQSWSVSVDMT